ncbi:hypothetical protein C7999DRAFT_13342 [Corynascus novoguineensis]|uniref:SH3 domain-containing protein n=1 Tax=Corynascus novoguineensis TaxID=1126955 RepID=A0AAN7CWT1_9PEZI|nr:hypothetical protein C7999DRAFT_13342 [Corynascus novoguineensis]
MQSMQRQFNKLLSKGPGENAKVAVLLNDYEDADNILAKIIDDTRMWRDSWAALTNTQLQVVTEYEGLYDPIAGATDGQSRHAVPTPQLQLERTFKLKVAYTELKSELTDEMLTIEDHILKPATDARECIAPIRKTIKKRENKRLDYEKAQDKALKLQRKPGRNSKEEAALAKADAEMARAADEFAIADEHLKETLPPIIHAAFSLVTPLLSNLVMIQNRLLGLYYTTLHSYCEEFGFPSPPPPMEEVVTLWNGAFGPIRSEIETISFIARGKCMQHGQQPTSTGNGNSFPQRPSPLNGTRRSTTAPGLISGPQARTLRTPSMPLDHGRRTPSPSPSSSTSTVRSRVADYSNATDFTTASILGGAAVVSLQNQHHQQQQQRQSPSFAPPTNGSAATAAAAAAAVLGKKKPPPPPPKRMATNGLDDWVVAQYDFTGQGSGDLSFREGDRIRVVKRTETDQDWWVGELDGVKGNFPANYCKPLSF